MYQWFKVTVASTEKRRKLIANTKDAFQVHGPEKTMYLRIPDTEIRWLDKTLGSLGLSKSPCEEPTYTQAPCGVFTTKIMYHPLACRSCMALRGVTPKASVKKQKREGKRGGPVSTVFKLPDIGDMSMDGLVGLLEKCRDEMMNLAATYETLILAIGTLKEAEARRKSLEAEVMQARNALQFFLQEAGADTNNKNS